MQYIISTAQGGSVYKMNRFPVLSLCLTSYLWLKLQFDRASTINKQGVHSEPKGEALPDSHAFRTALIGFGGLAVVKKYSSCAWLSKIREGGGGGCGLRIQQARKAMKMVPKQEWKWGGVTWTAGQCGKMVYQSQKAGRHGKIINVDD